MTTLLVVRHGQTAWNQEERFRGRADLPLDETGLKEAEMVARRIAAGYRPAAIYTSPLQRAVQTAEIIAQHLGLSAQPHGGLLDLDYGDLTGLSPVEAQAQHAGLYHTWLAAPHTVRFPNGESLAAVQDRVASLMHQVTIDHPRETVVLVSHLAVCRVLLCCLLGIHNGHVERFQVDHASLTICQVDQSTKTLVVANDTCHLIRMG